MYYRELEGNVKSFNYSPSGRGTGKWHITLQAALNYPGAD
jgi:hypothetical protein